MADRVDEPHAHTDAVYKVVSLRDGKFAVELLVAGSLPATITSFLTESDADRWIADHKAEVAKGVPKRRSYKQARHWLHLRRTHEQVDRH